jgi:hypothetical protein
MPLWMTLTPTQAVTEIPPIQEGEKAVAAAAVVIKLLVKLKNGYNQ